MATITIGTNTYPSFVTVAEADDYLAADVERAATWEAREDDEKGRGLVSATRFLLRLEWADTPPDPDGTPPQVVKDACCLLAADMLTNPTLYSNPSTASNVKSAGAGSAKVEFFRPQSGTPLPTLIWSMLGPLLGSASGGVSGSYGAAYGTDQCSRFDPTDHELTGPFQ